MSTENTTDAEAEDTEIGSADSWESLDRGEQDDILQERLEEDASVATPDIPDGEQMSAIERLEGKLEETWQAVIMDDVVVECYQLSEAQMDEVWEWAELVFEVDSGAEEDPEEVDDDLIDELGEMEEWLITFLADLTASDEMDEDYWESGERFPKGTRLDLFMEVFIKHQEDIEQTQSFRQE